MFIQAMGNLRIVSATLLCIAVAACGTTVRQTSSATRVVAQDQSTGLSTDQGSGLTADQGVDPSGDTSLDAPADTSTDPASAPGISTGDSGLSGAPVAPGTSTRRPSPTTKSPTRRPTSSAKPSTVKATTKAPSAGPVVNGPGVTSTEIDFGYIYSSGGAAQQAALGNTAGAQVSAKDLVEAYVDEVNQKGGINGRKLVVKYQTFDPTTTQTADQLAADFCAHYSDDVKVLMVYGFATGNMISCLAKAGVVSYGTGAAYTDKEFARYANYVDTGGTSLDSLAKNLVDTLVSTDYFSGWNTTTGAASPTSKPVVGILAPEDPNFPGWVPMVKEVLVPELARKGIVVDPSNIVYWSGASNQDAVASISAAELKFASQGVTHVIPTEVNGLAFFSSQAETQHYRPRYAINTLNYASAEAGTLVPTAQLTGATGLGFGPATDLTQAESAKPQYVGPGATACLAVMKAHNVDTTAIADQAKALGVCDIVGTVRAAAAAVPRTSPLTGATFVQTIGGLGTSFASAAIPAAAFSAAKRYALTKAWAMVWDTSCTCLVYKGQPFTLR